MVDRVHITPSIWLLLCQGGKSRLSFLYKKFSESGMISMILQGYSPFLRMIFDHQIMGYNFDTAGWKKVERDREGNIDKFRQYYPNKVQR